MDYNVTYRTKDKGIQCIISYKDENGKWRQKSKQGFKTQKESKPWIKKIVEELEEEINLKKVLDPTLNGITFGELMEKYISHKELHREYGSVKLIQYAWRKFETLNDMPVTDITKAHTQDCVDMMVKEGLAHNTLTNYIALVKAAFYYAMDKKLINENPLHKMTIPEDKEEPKGKALNKWELDDLLNKIENPLFKLVSMIAGTCGLRLGEILGLTWDDVNFKTAKLTINKQWKKLEDGKNGIGPVKRKNSNRVVPIPKETLDALKVYKENSPVHVSKRIFYTRTSRNNLTQELGDLYKKLGYDVTPHDLRHTYGTLLVAQGLDFKTVAELLGHDVETTIKTYSHVTDEMREKAANVIENIFN